MRFDSSEIAFSHLDNNALKRANLLFLLMSLRFLAVVGPKIIALMLFFRLPVLGLIRMTLFSHFCGGESIEDAQKTVVSLARRGIGAILDYSVEGISDKKSLDLVLKELKSSIDQAKGAKAVPFAVFKVSGLARPQLLEKIQNLEVISNEEAQEFSEAKNRIEALCQHAAQSKVKIFIDAEESWIQDVIDGIAEDMMKRFNQKETYIFTTLQMYRIDRMEYLIGLHNKALEGGYKVGVKVVRGAYMEKERARALRFHQPSPIHPDQFSTDRDYNLALEYCVENRDIFSICAGTHNEFSSLKLVNLMEVHHIEKNDPRFFFAQLLGMSDHISNVLALSGYNVAKYVPYGPLKEVLPYLFRRAQENTSIAGQAGRELTLLKKEVMRRRLKGI
ncbi:MAG: proline dehydrogenase family protein [Pseudomonadota bacterium]